MFGKASHLNPLALQKRFLVAESEVNRAHLSMEWQVLADEARGCADKAKTVAWTSAAALLIVGLTASRHSRAGAKPEKPSWFQRVLKVAELANSILQVFRAACPQSKAADS